MWENGVPFLRTPRVPKNFLTFKTRNTKEQRSRKVEEKQRMEKWKGEEEEAEAGGETVIDKMEVARDMEVTGNVVVNGCGNKNWWFLASFFFWYQPGLDLLAETSNFRR